jgi:hypothetical protein
MIGKSSFKQQGSFGIYNAYFCRKEMLISKFISWNYWVFGLYPSSNILKTRENNVSETGTVSVLIWGGGGGKNPNTVGSLRKS